MNVREATAEDFPAMIEMGRAMHEESEFRFLPFDEGKLVDLGREYVSDPYKLLLVCIDSEGRTVGMFAGYLSTYYFCNERLACELFWYVKPESRGTSAAVRMLKAFAYWAQGNKAREMSVGISTGVGVDAFGRMLERMGFAFRGGNYKMRLA